MSSSDDSESGASNVSVCENGWGDFGGSSILTSFSFASYFSFYYCLNNQIFSAPDIGVWVTTSSLFTLATSSGRLWTYFISSCLTTSGLGGFIIILGFGGDTNSYLTSSWISIFYSSSFDSWGLIRFSLSLLMVSLFFSYSIFFFSSSSLHFYSSYYFLRSSNFFSSSFFLSTGFQSMGGGGTNAFLYSSLPILYFGSFTFLVGYMYQGISFETFSSSITPPVAASTWPIAELMRSLMGQSFYESFGGLYLAYLYLCTLWNVVSKQLFYFSISPSMSALLVI